MPPEPTLPDDDVTCLCGAAFRAPTRLTNIFGQPAEPGDAAGRIRLVALKPCPKCGKTEARTARRTHG